MVSVSKGTVPHVVCPERAVSPGRLCGNDAAAPSGSDGQAAGLAGGTLPTSRGCARRMWRVRVRAM